MRSVNFYIGVYIFVASRFHVKAQTSTDCNPLQKACPPNPGLGTSVYTDFTTGKSEYWQPLPGTSPNYDGSKGAQLNIKNPNDAPTMVLTKYIMFGHVDMVAKSSPGTGIVSSFVLLSQDLDEIDWEWLGGDNGNVQTNFFGKGDTSSYDRATTISVQTPVDTFHTYSIDWTAERIIWQIDGKPVRTLTSTDPLTKGGQMYPQTPMQVKIGNWIGCLDQSNPKTIGTCQWAGGQADLSKGPFVMAVKSINVTDYGCGGDYTFTDQSGSWKSIKSSGKCDGKGTGPGAAPIASAISAENPITGESPPIISADKNPPKLPGSPARAAPAPDASAGGGSILGTNSTNTTSPQTSQTTSKPSIVNPTEPKLKPNGSSSTSNTSIIGTSGASGKAKHSYGKIDVCVGILGLVFGYLVM